MDKQDILDRLRENERGLRERGVTHAALFGSRARGDNRPDSDIDIMIDIAPDAVQDVYAYVGLKNYIAGLFAGKVDVVDREALKPYLRLTVTAELGLCLLGRPIRGSGCLISVTTSGLRALSSGTPITTRSATTSFSFMR